MRVARLCLLVGGVDKVEGVLLVGSVDSLNHIGFIELALVNAQQRPMTKQALKVFPNPASDVVTVQLSSPEHNIQLYEVFDVAGKMLMREIVNAPTKNISLQHLSAGLYSIKVTYGGNFETVRVVKN